MVEFFVGDVFDVQPSDPKQALPFLVIRPIWKRLCEIHLGSHLGHTLEVTRLVGAEEKEDWVFVVGLDELMIEVIVDLTGRAPDIVLDGLGAM